MKKDRLLFVALLFVFMLILLILSQGYHPVARQLPRLVCLVTLVLLGYDLLAGLVGRSPEPAKKSPGIEKLPRPVLVKRWITIITGLLSYVVFLPHLGFLVMTSLFILVLLWVFNERRASVLVLYTGLTVGILYLVFIKLFFVPLPMGDLWLSLL